MKESFDDTNYIIEKLINRFESIEEFEKSK